MSTTGAAAEEITPRRSGACAGGHTIQGDGNTCPCGMYRMSVAREGDFAKVGIVRTERDSPWGGDGYWSDPAPVRISGLEPGVPYFVQTRNENRVTLDAEPYPFHVDLESCRH